MKTIFHVDMDAFFVSVEELFQPDLKGKPVVVGGKPGERGVVAAASYAARKYGIHSAMPLRTAARLCPNAIFLEGHPDRYREYSHKVFEVLNSFSPQVEMASIDEAYLDMTGTERLHGPPLKAAHALHESIRRKTGLNCSIGIAASRMVAKVASDQAKPNGLLWVLPGEEAHFLAPLEVGRLPGVGKVTQDQLRRIGVRRVGDLAQVETACLERWFGKWGLALAGKAQGEDSGGWFDREIGGQEPPKSISHEHTFSRDTNHPDELAATLVHLTEKVCHRLREHGLTARTVQVKIRYAGFQTVTRAHTLKEASDIDAVILREAQRLFHANWSTGDAVRLLGIQVSGLQPGAAQMNLLEVEQQARWRRALAAVDDLRHRFGQSSVTLAGGLQGRHPEKTHENPADLPGKASRK